MGINLHIGGCFVLSETGEPVQEPDISKWAEWMRKQEQHVSLDEFEIKGHHVVVSTVFLGLDHSSAGSEWPVLWETMIFGLPSSMDGEYQRRYASRKAALEGHQIALVYAKDFLSSYLGSDS